MKHKKIYRIFAALLTASLLLSLAACGDDESEGSEYIVGTDYIKYKLQGVEDFGFNINFISKNKKAEVELVGVSGENTQGLTITMQDDTFDELQGNKYNGYYIKLLGFVCKTANDYVRIDSIQLKIDGEEKTFELATPIEHTVADRTEEQVVSIHDYPLFISTCTVSEQYYNFKYYADKSVTITGFEFSDFIMPDDAVVSVDGKKMGNLDEAFPLTISEGESVSIYCKLEFKEGEASTYYDWIYCDSILSYYIDDEEDLHTLHTNLVSQSVSNEIDAENAIEVLIQ